MQMLKPDLKKKEVFLLIVTSENTVRTGDRSRAGLQQVQLCVEDLSVSFSWQGDDGDVYIISSAVTMEPSVQRRRLERT